MLRDLIRFISVLPEKYSFRKQVKALTGFSPGSVRLYRCALTHKSIIVSADSNHSCNNERLEFLGDAILSATVADYLYMAFPGCKEGFLTQMRSKLVSRDNLNNIANKMGLERLVLLNSDTTLTKKHIYGNALEALIGAIYIDKGFKKTKKFIIEKIISQHLDVDQMACEDRDFKSQIIQWGQKNKQEISFESYEITEDDNPRPLFVATIHIMDIPAGEGFGATKKEAQQLAARQALMNLPS